MSADLLRQAADRLDALADAATPGPWSTMSHAEPEKGCRCMSCYEPAWAWEVAEVDGPTCKDSDVCNHVMHLGWENAAYIAAMHPGVAKALAAWLREVQEYHRLGVHALGDGALTLARAILAAPPLTAQVTRPPSVT